VTPVLIIVQNPAMPFDRRVWLECQALVSDGHEVAVVCPKGRGDPAYEVINAVKLYKYRPYAPGGSKLSFITKYACSFLATAWLTLRARRSGRFAAMQACNPPDIFWPIALALRAVDRTRFVFDHHGLCPELFQSRYPAGPGLPYRGGEPSPELGRGRQFLAAYIGVMGPQDGVDIVVRAADIVVHQFGCDDIAFTLIGSGDCFDDLVALPGRARRVHRARARRAGRARDVDCGPGPVTGSQESAQRRVNHEQDHGAHALRASGGRV
jgi:hypothetical protein